jgi:hypothetical protein
MVGGARAPRKGTAPTSAAPPPALAQASPCGPGRTPAGIDLSAFEVPEGMVVSSITLSPAVEREVEEEEPATDEEAEEARRTSRSYPRER